LQDFGQRFLRDTVHLRQVLGTAWPQIGVLGQMSHGDQPVVRFFGQLQQTGSRSQLLRRIGDSFSRNLILGQRRGRLQAFAGKVRDLH